MKNDLITKVNHLHQNPLSRMQKIIVLIYAKCLSIQKASDKNDNPEFMDILKSSKFLTTFACHILNLNSLRNFI